MLDVAERSITSQPVSARDVLASWFAGRLMILGSAGLGFIVTFLLLVHEIASLKNALVPLLVFLPVYLLLLSLTMVWTARSVWRIGQPLKVPIQQVSAHRVQRIVMALCSLAFGAVAALAYIHTVAK